MNKITQMWWFPLVVVFVVATVVVILIITAIKPKKNKDMELLLQQQTETIRALERINEKSDSIIIYQQDIIENNREKETVIIRDYRNVPARVQNLSKEDLRKEINDAYK